MIRVLIIAWFISGAVFAQSPSPTPSESPVLIQMPNSHISDFVKLYQSLTKRKVWIDAELRFDRTMSISLERPIPRAEAISLLRDALRKEGVEVREAGDAEAYVSRVAPSRDPVAPSATPRTGPQSSVADTSDPFADISVSATPPVRGRSVIRKAETPR